MQEPANKQFFLDLQTAAKEVFTIVQWLIVTVAMTWAAYRINSTALSWLSLILMCALICYAMAALTKLLEWIDPRLSPNAPDTRVKKFTAFGVLFLALLGQHVGQKLANDLSRIEQMRSPMVDPIPSVHGTQLISKHLLSSRGSDVRETVPAR